ncbi:MAG: adenylate/guanylate cyclase domain-containing protein, partial [archaeon]
MQKEYFHKKSFLIYFLILLVFSFLIFVNSFSHVKNVLSDNLHGGNKPLENIVIIKIDDESINKIGRWPWDRNVFSEILLKTKDARVIGIDVSFFEKSINDSSLNKTLRSMNNVVLASEMVDGKLFKPIFETNTGYTNLLSSRDGVLRNVEVGISSENLPFAFEIYKKYSEKENFEKGIYTINFVSKPNSFSSIGAYEALNGNFDFKGKIVLIGATAPDLHDNYFVPTSEGTAMPGVEIHANILQNIFLNNFVKKQNNFSIFFFIFLFSFTGFFFFSKIKIYYLVPLIILIILIYAGLGIFIFNNYNYLVDFFFFPVSLFIFTGSGVALNYLEEKKHSAYLTGAFGKYISKDLLNEIVNRKQELKLGGEKRKVTIFFSDIRGFTSISEKLSPEGLVNLLNEYLTEMTKIILENKGTVDKFIGDAIMALWNAPLTQQEHAKLACKAAIEQIKKLEFLRNSWKEKDFPVVEIGCGINTGDAIIGNMGSEERFDYTAMGDAVNIASRLEGLTKQYGVKIIISKETKDLVGNEFNFRLLDKVKVKGKKNPVEIYELLWSEENKGFAKEYENALSLYFDKKFS